MFRSVGGTPNYGTRQQCTRLRQWKELLNFISLKHMTQGIFLEIDKSLMCSFYQFYIRHSRHRNTQLDQR
jgi:hypothetical protein